MADVYVVDRAAGSIQWASAPSGGGQPDAPSTSPAISADGRFLAFESSASNLVVGDVNGECDVFVFDCAMGTLERISVSWDGSPEDGGSDYPSISLCNTASHRAVEQRLGRKLSICRWRGNIWFDGLPLWEEFDWLDREVRIGDAVFHVKERITRCLATTANPETGQRDADTLGALRSWDHQDFGVYATVIRGGTIRRGDEVQVL